MIHDFLSVVLGLELYGYHQIQL